MNAGRSRFFTNTASLAIAVGVSAVFTLLQVKILSAYLRPDVFGSFAAMRGLSLFVSMLASNGLPQLLTRFIPQHEAEDRRGAAVGISVVCYTATLLLVLAGMWIVYAGRASIFGGVDETTPSREFVFWFGMTTLGVALKLVLYGGLNGIRRMSVQTVLEVISLAVQVAWIYAYRDRLTLTGLFKILGTVSVATLIVGVPWYFALLGRHVGAGGERTPVGAGEYGHYWIGATGLTLVALAFTDVDRFLLSHVLALEALALFHIGARIVKLANTFMSVPVLAFQPEVTRLYAERRGPEVFLSTRVFVKGMGLIGAFAAVLVAVFGRELVLGVSNPEYLGALPLLLLLAASIPMSAMTAPLTAEMKAHDRVRSAFVCDLAWALVYVASLFLFGRWLGIVGAGVAQLTACLVQLSVAVALSRHILNGVDAVGALVRAFTCAAIACAPAYAIRWLPVPGWLAVVAKLVLVVVGLQVFRGALVVTHALSSDERLRLVTMLDRPFLGAVARRMFG